ncbi:RluA family pseudouridine synthase [bacterium]|nr:RluA family pseudouridine synthase [bacterium]
MKSQFVDIVVPEGAGTIRLDQFLTDTLPDASRSFAKKLIKNGQVLVNAVCQEKANYRVHPNDFILVNVPPPRKLDMIAQDIPLDIVFEDDHLLVINKSAGLVVHPAAGNYEGTLVNALLHHCSNLSGIGGVERPGIVHRLDKNTSGLLVVAKDDVSHRGLSEQFANRTIVREYYALLWGHLKESEGRVETWLNRNTKDRKVMMVSSEGDGKFAATNFQVLKEFAFTSLVTFKLDTGRTHQIRIHAKHLGHPLFGDPEYHGRERQVSQLLPRHRYFAEKLLNEMPYQALYARKLGFTHPVTGKFMEFESNFPDAFQSVLDQIEAYEGV